MIRTPCKLHKIELQNRKYQVFISQVSGKFKQIFVHREKEKYFYIPPGVKKTYFLNDEYHFRTSFQYIDKRGYKVTYEGLDRFVDDNAHELILNQRCSLYKAIELIEFVQNMEQPSGIKNKNFNCWKLAVIEALKKYK